MGKRISKIGLIIGVLAVMILGYGGWCKKSSSSSGSSGILPAQVVSPNPANGATDVSTNTGLSWASASGATSYNVYADDFNPPTTLVENTTNTSLPGPKDGLAPMTTYYWRVDAKNSAGTTTGIVWNFTTGLLPTYDISGTISYEGAKTGRIFIKAGDNNGMGFGTSISPTGTYTIRGVEPGEYSLYAWMDYIGQGCPNSISPISNTAIITVTNSSLTGIDITLLDPTPPSAISPTGLAVMPGDESAFLVWDVSVDVQGCEKAESYNVYCGDIGVSKSSFTISTTTPARYDTHLFMDSLTNGNDYYFVVTSVLNGAESAESDTFGPVTINPPVGGYTVSGQVSFPVEAEGKTMCVVVYSDTGAGVFWTITTTLTSPMDYEVLNVANGDFMLIAFIDMNENGLMDLGDISNMGFEGEATQSVTVDFVPVTDKNITLTADNAIKGIATWHRLSDSAESYGLSMEIYQAMKLPVKVVLTVAPNLAVPRDIGYYMNGCVATFNLGSIRPEVGQTYTFDVTYSDESNETLNASVTTVLDSFAIDLTTTGDPTLPTFIWVAPTSPPASYTYWLEMVDVDGNDFWETDDMPSTQTWVDYDLDPIATPGIYYWELAVVDDNGNEAIYQEAHIVP